MSRFRMDRLDGHTAAATRCMRRSGEGPTMKLARLLLTMGAVLTPALATGQSMRQDAIWARRSTSPITLNGVLDEPAWARAETKIVKFGIDNGIPGSGWKYEGGVVSTDQTQATLKFLVVGNVLYLGAVVPDKSIGGSKDFNRFDGLLMSIKDKADPGAPKPPSEYFYAWWYSETMDPQPANQVPAFIGRWATSPAGSPRTPEQIAAWDAVTVINGISNSDAANDVGYTVEMKFDLGVMGYNVTQPGGDIIEWNVSVYDCDWFWPLDIPRFTSNRVWWQSPWGNAMWYDEVHIYARPDITVNSNVLPAIGAELVVPNGDALAAPTIDGLLSEGVWSSTAYSFDIRWDDAALRATYPGVGPERAGQFQPTVNGGMASVLDRGDATVKLLVRGNFLYLGFDARDQVVQHHSNIDRWDGFIVTINDRVARGLDQELRGRRLTFQVGPTGAAVAQDYLPTMVSGGSAQVALALKAGTTVDTLGMTADTGYTAELRLDLTALGYPSGLGDRALFLGVNHLDGDSFVPFTDSYATRTWWFREYEGQCCPVWAYMAPGALTDAGEPDDAVDGSVLLGAFPNPLLRQSMIRYALTRSSQVTLAVHDVAGRLVQRRVLGMQRPGMQEAAFDGMPYGAGVYMYKLDIADPETGALRRSLSGRMVVIK